MRLVRVLSDWSGSSAIIKLYCSRRSGVVSVET